MHCSTHSDRDYKHAFVDFIKSGDWDWFITIPIGSCDSDELLLKRLRRIENELCRKYLVNRYHKLPDGARFSFVVAFEGMRDNGTRHAHLLARIPVPNKKRISRSMLIDLFPGDFRFIWHRLKHELAGRKATSPNADQHFDEWMSISFGRVNVARSIYTVKDARQFEVPWSRIEFVTAPKSKTFKNGNLSVIRNRNCQKRRHLKRVGDDRFANHVV